MEQRQTDEPHHESRWFSVVSAVQERLEALPGFGGLDIDGASVRLAWKGPLPPAAQAVLVDLPPDTVVTVVPARYELTELLAAASRLMAVGGSCPPRVVGVSPRADGSGLDVEVLVEDDGRGEAGLTADRVVLPTHVPYRVEVVSDLPRALGAGGSSGTA